MSEDSPSCRRLREIPDVDLRALNVPVALRAEILHPADGLPVGACLKDEAAGVHVRVVQAGLAALYGEIEVTARDYRSRLHAAKDLSGGLADSPFADLRRAVAVAIVEQPPGGPLHGLDPFKRFSVAGHCGDPAVVAEISLQGFDHPLRLLGGEFPV